MYAKVDLGFSIWIYVIGFSLCNGLIINLQSLGFKKSTNLLRADHGGFGFAFWGFFTAPCEAYLGAFFEISLSDPGKRASFLKSL